MTAPGQALWSKEAEQSVLGGLLLDNSAAWRVAELKPEHFHRGDHRAIFAGIMAEVGARRPADPVTVFEAMGKRADESGGLQYLNALAQSVPSASNIGRYAEIVIDRAMRRAMLAALDEATAIAHEGDGSAAEKLDRIVGQFAGMQQRGARSEPRALGDLMSERLHHWEALATGEVIAAIPTRLPTLDRALGGGVRPGMLYVLAARPSVGKTSLAGQLALTCAAQGRKVLVLSQEMRARDLADRVAANLVGLNLATVTTGQFGEGDWTRATEAVEKARRLPLHIDEQPGLTIAAINAKARRHRQRHGLDVLVVDYLQLCAGSAQRESRNHQIEEISRGLLVLAKDLDIVVVALSQLNRQSTHRDEPELADMRDSGAIEQDADVVILLHPKSKLPDGSLLVAAIVAKGRQGPRGRVALSFRGETQQWVESTADVSRGAERASR